MISYIGPIPAYVIPILIVFSIPIIAILTHHQRKMAELMRRDSQAGNGQPQLLDEIRQIQHRLDLMDDKINRLALQADVTNRNVPETPIQQRLKSDA